MANASCWNARQKASRSKRRKRRTTGPRVAGRGTGRNWELESGCRSCSSCGLAAMGDESNAEKQKGGLNTAPLLFLRLLCRQFLGLAFVPHQLERTLSFLVRLRDFYLHLRGRFFHFWREANVAVVLHAGACRNETSDDDVLLQATKVIHGALYRCFGEHPGGLLERGCGDK